MARSVATARERNRSYTFALLEFRRAPAGDPTMLRFHFPIVIIDEDFRSENTSGLGIRALASAIEKEGMEVLGVTSYGDLCQFAQQQSRASAFILSIDDEEFTPGPELDPAVLNLRKFIGEIRRRNAEIPIYLYGETRTSQHIPNDILRELHGFIHMFEDTPEFVARHIIREARSYLDGVAPPFFKALVDYAQDGSYSWHCPGHSGGVAFLKSPVGQMFHQFFGENMLRADVCNSVDELGQLLDHTGPVADSEKNAARIFNADHCFFVTNGTQHQQQDGVAPHGGAGRRGGGRPQLPQDHPALDHHDRRHSRVPDADAQPPRHHRPDPARRVRARGDRPPHGQEPAAGRQRRQQEAAAHPDHHAEHLRRRALQRRPIKAMLDGFIDTLHFDEAWLPHATFHEFYNGMHAIGKERPRPKAAMVFSTQSTHKLLAGLSQASQMLVHDSETRSLDQHLFNEAYLMHTSTSPQYAIIASCDVAAAMMEPPGGTALVEESILEAIEFRRAMRKIDKEWGSDWWFQVWGPPKLAHEGIGRRDDWMLSADEKWHGFGDLAPGFNMLDPIKSTIITPGLDVTGKFAKTGIPASIVTKYLAEHGVVVEKTGLYSFFIMFTIGITKGRWNTLLTALQQFKDDYDKNAPMWRVLPEFCAAPAQVRAHGPARPEPGDPRDLRQGRHRAADHRDVPVGPAAGDEAVGSLCAHRAPRHRAGADRRARGPHHHRAADAVPAGHPAADSRRALQPPDRRVPAVRAGVQRALPRLRHRRARPGRERDRGLPPLVLRRLRQRVRPDA